MNNQSIQKLLKSKENKKSYKLVQRSYLKKNHIRPSEDYATKSVYYNKLFIINNIYNKYKHIKRIVL